MKRRDAVRAFIAGCIAPGALFAQAPGKVWHIGYLAALARPPDGSIPAPLRTALRALGYSEGQNIAYVGRWAESKTERLGALADELLALKVDLIVAQGGPAAAAAKKTFSATPIVAYGAGDVIETGLVASLAHPGGNLTGINDQAAVLSAKRLEMLKELVPGARRVAVLWNTGDNAMTLRYHAIERAAKVLGVGIEPLGVREPDDFDVALAAMSRARPDALMMVTDSLTTMHRQRVLDYAEKQRIPAMYESALAVRAGGLMSYGFDPEELLKLAADYIARIIEGRKPADLPVQQPNRYYLVINLGKAKILGITIPQSLLLRAEEVIP